MRRQQPLQQHGLEQQPLGRMAHSGISEPARGWRSEIALFGQAERCPVEEGRETKTGASASDVRYAGSRGKAYNLPNVVAQPARTTGRSGTGGREGKKTSPTKRGYGSDGQGDGAEKIEPRNKAGAQYAEGGGRAKNDGGCQKGRCGSDRRNPGGIWVHRHGPERPRP